MRYFTNITYLSFVHLFCRPVVLLFVVPFSCFPFFPVVPLSHCYVVPLLGCLVDPLSYCPIVSMSNCPAVWISSCLDVQLSGCSVVPLSLYSVVLLSHNPFASLSGCPVVPYFCCPVVLSVFRSSYCLVVRLSVYLYASFDQLPCFIGHRFLSATLKSLKNSDSSCVIDPQHLCH